MSRLRGEPFKINTKGSRDPSVISAGLDGNNRADIEPFGAFRQDGGQDILLPVFLTHPISPGSIFLSNIPVINAPLGVRNPMTRLHASSSFFYKHDQRDTFL